MSELRVSNIAKGDKMSELVTLQREITMKKVEMWIFQWVSHEENNLLLREVNCFL